jgi:hypothetical protein
MSHSHLVCIEGDYAYNFQTKELDAIYKNKKLTTSKPPQLSQEHCLKLEYARIKYQNIQQLSQGQASKQLTKNN